MTEPQETPGAGVPPESSAPGAPRSTASEAPRSTAPEAPRSTAPEAPRPGERSGGAGGWLATGIVTAILLGLIGWGWTQRGNFTAAEVGAHAPDFTLPHMDGGEASLSQYEGEVVLLNFWATWCAPCVYEMPSMERLYQDFRERGFVVLGVSVDVDPGDRDADGRLQGIVRDYVDELGVTFPILLDPGGVVDDLYDVSGLPTTYVIGRNGRIEGRVVGGREWDSDEYRRRIEELL